MVIIQRKPSFSNSTAKYSVYLNGEKAATLSEGERAELNVPDGSHSLQVKLNISESNIITFETNDQQPIHFETGSNINVLKNILNSLLHPAILVSIFFLNKIIPYKYFIVYALLAYIAFEIYTYIKRKRRNKILDETEKYYLYLKLIPQ